MVTPDDWWSEPASGEACSAESGEDSGIIYPHIFSMLSRIEICLSYVCLLHYLIRQFDMKILFEVL